MARDHWFKDAKYGLFIHWGIYSMLGGVYKGEKIPYGAKMRKFLFRNIGSWQKLLTLWILTQRILYEKQKSGG